MAIRLGFISSLLLLFQGSWAAHIMGGHISADYVSEGIYDFTLVIYADCFGGGSPPAEQNVFFFPDDFACAFPFSFPFQLVSIEEVSGLCPSEIEDSSCNGGFLPGVNKITYQAEVTIEMSCIWEVYWASEDWFNFNNVDNASLPTAHIGSMIYPSIDGFDTIDIESIGSSYWCLGDEASYNFSIANPAGWTLTFELDDILTTGGVPVLWEDGFSGNAPIPGITIDSNTGELQFSAPPAIGSYAVGVRISMFNGDGVLVGEMLESMVVINRTCSVDCMACTDEEACNYDPEAAVNDGSCYYNCAACVSDLNDDGTVNTQDLLVFLGGYGCFPPLDCSETDLNEDQQVDTEDLLLFLSAYGTNCDQ